MKRAFVASLVILISLATLAGADYRKRVASEPERTLVLRVRTTGSAKHATFSGQLQEHLRADPIILHRQSTPFGIKVRAESLKGYLRKDTGSPDLHVELIEFIDDREVGSITKTGATFDIEAHQLDGKGVLSIR